MFTNQNLFVPSQAHKIKQLFKDFSMESFFNLGHLSGKGEVANHVYVLKKRAHNDNDERESCLTFRWSGQLAVFGKFETLVSKLCHFFKEKNPLNTFFYGKQIDNDFNFEFHQDAITEGKLLSLIIKNGDNVTHPSFFKQLSKNFVPLDNFFNIENISDEKAGENKFPARFLGPDFKSEKLFSHLLITDHRDPKTVRLKIIPFANYQREREKNGTFLFKYFGLTQKIDNLDTNLFQEFFNNEIGTQIIQLAINQGKAKLKSKLKMLLVPKFFSKPDATNHSLQKALAVISSNPPKWEEIPKAFKTLEKLGEVSPNSTLRVVSNFKHNLINAMGEFSDEIDYSNNNILNPLLNLENHSIIDNQDIHISYQITSEDDLHLPLENIKLLKDTKEGISLNIYASDKLLIKMYSEPEMLEFIEFLLSAVSMKPVSEVIKNLKIPPLAELKKIINKFKLNKESSKNEIEYSINFIQNFFNKMLRSLED